MNIIGIKSVVAVSVLAVIVFLARAEEVSADLAGVAAQRWLQDDAALGCSLGSEVDSVRTCSPQADASFHVVKLKEGGFVVMSSDTTREPVVAFSSGGDLVESDANPMWVLLKKDLALRMGEGGATNRKSGLLKATGGSSSASGNEAKWNRLLGKTRGLLRSSQGVSFISDVRVAPLVKSKWKQGNVGGSPCYNYYTPNNYPCGCVATAGAQIMRYFEWPRSPVAQFANTHCAVGGATRTLTMQGGYYDWSQMPLEPNSSITDAQRQEIGKLTSDIGICVGMSYASNGSGAGGYMLAEAFTNRYGYANSLSMEWNGDISGSDDMKNALLSNLDAGLPVAIGLIDNADNGHEIVGDGYGYSGNTLYLHFNMGWGGSEDAWYAPPQMANELYDFSVLNGFVCNIFTNSAYANGVICSGRVLDATGSPIADAAVFAKKNGNIVANTVSNSKGIYAFILPAGSYEVLASRGDAVSAPHSITLSANVGTEIITSGASYGRYWPGEITIGNRCGQDITITGVAGVAEPQFNPASCLFYPSTNVEITCATSGATIRYTTDGSDPTESSAIYKGPITVDDDIQIRARAWRSGMNPSAVVVGTYTYDNSFNDPKGDRFANPIVISGASGSRTIANNSAYTVEAGEPNHTHEDGYEDWDEYRTVWYKWTAPGSGTMTFVTEFVKEFKQWTFTAAVAAYTGSDITSLSRLDYSYDEDEIGSASITINVEQGNTYHIVGLVLWDTATGGTFTLSWFGDLTVPQTSTTEVPVTYTWLDEYFPGRASATGDYETIATGDADGDGLATWAEYLLGTDPTNVSSRLEVTIRMDGMTPIVECNADTNRLATFGYQPVVKGKQTLDSAVDWADMDSLLHRFFKVFIEKE